MPDYNEIWRKAAELSNLRQMPSEKVVEYEQYFASLKFRGTCRCSVAHNVCDEPASLAHRNTRNDAYHASEPALAFAASRLI